MMLSTPSLLRRRIPNLKVKRFLELSFPMVFLVTQREPDRAKSDNRPAWLMVSPTFRGRTEWHYKYSQNRVVEESNRPYHRRHVCHELHGDAVRWVPYPSKYY